MHEACISDRWLVEVGGPKRRWRLHLRTGSPPTPYELGGWQQISGCVRATAPDGRVQIVWAQAGRYRITHLA